jgi:hypothetical protein
MISGSPRHDRLNIILVAGLKLRAVATPTPGVETGRRGEMTLMVGWPMLFVHGGVRHPGNVLAGAINHRGIAVACHPVGHRKLAGMTAVIGHLAHGHRLEVRVGRVPDMRWVRAAVDEVMLRVEGETVVHL